MKARLMDYSKLLWLAGLALTIVSNAARAEDPSLFQALAGGDSSVAAQYYEVNSAFNACVQQITDHPPARNDGYVIAMTKWQQEGCAIYNCFMNADLMASLASTSNNPAVGGSSNQQTQCGNIQATAAKLNTYLQTAAQTSPSGFNCQANINTFVVQIVQAEAANCH